MRASVLLVVLLLAGCGGSSRSPVRVIEATTWSGGDAIRLSVAACNASPSATVVDQTADEVRVEVQADTPGSARDACSDLVVACLDEPLGDRALVDEVSGVIGHITIAEEEPVPRCPVSEDPSER